MKLLVLFQMMVQNCTQILELSLGPMSQKSCINLAKQLWQVMATNLETTLLR